jgi:hypothetical protein
VTNPYRLSVAASDGLDDPLGNGLVADEADGVADDVVDALAA